MQRQVLPERDLEEGRRKERSEPGVPGFNLGFIRAEEMTNDISEQLSQTFGPTLTLMKLSGQFFGETSFSELRNLNPGKSVYLSRFYSLLVALSLWLYVILGLASLFSEGFTSVDVFLSLFTIATWSVQCACNVTICLAMLPQAQSKSGSRFSQFITSFFTRNNWSQRAEAKITKRFSFCRNGVFGEFCLCSTMVILSEWCTVQLQTLEWEHGSLDHRSWSWNIHFFRLESPRSALLHNVLGLGKNVWNAKGQSHIQPRYRSSIDPYQLTSGVSAIVQGTGDGWQSVFTFLVGNGRIGCTVNLREPVPGHQDYQELVQPGKYDFVFCAHVLECLFIEHNFTLMLVWRPSEWEGKITGV